MQAGKESLNDLAGLELQLAEGLDLFLFDGHGGRSSQFAVGSWQFLTSIGPLIHVHTILAWVTNHITEHASYFLGLGI